MTPHTLPDRPPAAPPLATPATLVSAATALFDAAQAELKEGDAMRAFRRLGAPLAALWTEARGCGAADTLRAVARQHSLYAVVQQDPYTRRATDKPRGYAGDAVMMDFIYRGKAPEGSSPLGQAVFAATTRVSMGLSVRWRRQFLRSLIDETAVAVEGARMLSVASGHCRELDGSLVQAPWFAGEFIALDQDPLSCAEVQQSQRSPRVRAVCQGVRELLADSTQPLGRFDLIYSAGLYDYLSDGLARRLTARLGAMLRPGGRLVMANFVPGGSGRGYMELFMDWTLVLRSPAELEALARQAGAGGVSSFVDPHRNVVYAELTREVSA